MNPPPSSPSEQKKNPRPTLTTNRLVLRPFGLGDAPRVQLLAGDPAIAATTLTIPHPYEDGLAEKWITSHEDDYKLGRIIHFALTLRDDRLLIGAMSLALQNELRSAELGYWIGRPYWNRGYGTEAAAAVIRYGFDKLRLNRIFAVHMTHNPASGRILEKIGMTKEGCHRQSQIKYGKFVDLNYYSILRTEYDTQKYST